MNTNHAMLLVNGEKTSIYVVETAEDIKEEIAALYVVYEDMLLGCDDAAEYVLDEIEMAMRRLTAFRIMEN